MVVGAAFGSEWPDGNHIRKYGGEPGSGLKEPALQ
mgnify:CR=1 FL=1